MSSEKLKMATIGKLCAFSNGHGFTPRDWKTTGLPIIRIQNLNGSQDFNYYQGEPKQEWLVQPGDLLFAWAGVKGVSFGPTIWKGPLGVLNQHIYRIHPVAGVNKDWLYYALAQVTIDIEKKAHGFKTSLVHVRKSDITNASVANPSPEGQTAIADLLSTWDLAIGKTERLIAAKEKGFSHNLRTMIDDNCGNWKHLRADKIFKSVSEKGNGGAELLSVTQDRGVIPRTMLEGRVMSPEGGTDSYKLIKKGDFAISLRSFQGGIEYSRYQGLISPAYTVLRPKVELYDEFYRHFFKSYLFIQKYLSIAVIGIRDGKQISIPDFMTVKIPLPPIEQQKQIASLLNTVQEEIDLLKKQADALRRQKRGLMQKLLIGEWRVKI